MTRVLLAALIVLLTTAASAWAQNSGLGPDRLYGSAEYILWWLKDSPAPTPLVSTENLDVPGHQVLLGGRDIDTNERHGGRYTLGYWLTNDHSWGVEAKYFFISQKTETSGVSSSGTPDSQLLVTPFFAVVPGSAAQSGESGLVLALPGSFAAKVTESLSSSMKGAELNVSRRMAEGQGWRLELVGGFRYLNLEEKYKFFVDSPLVPAVPGDVYQFGDIFNAGNDFFGGQLGVRGEYRRGPWFANGAVKLALGVMRQSVDVSGTFLSSEFNPNVVNNQLVSFGQAQLFPGGVFAQLSNIGSHKRDVFAVVPELTLNVGYDITSWASVFLGYTFLYANNVVRPGNQLDRRINPTQSALFNGAGATPSGEAVPAFKFRSTDFWAQGLNVGVTFRY